MSLQNYTLGRGKTSFAMFLPQTQIEAGSRYLGNTPSLAMNAETETLDHYSSDSGIRRKDQSVDLQRDRGGAFTTDSINPGNIALLMQGDHSTIATAAGTGVETLIVGAEQGLTYQLGVTPTAPAGARMVSDVVVTLTGTPATTYVLGTDYVIDPERGTLTLLERATGGIAQGANLTVTFDVAAASRIQIVSGAKTIEGALRYRADNAVGLNYDYYWPWVKLTPNGDFELKGDEWQAISFNFEVLEKDGLAAVYVDGQARTTAGG